MAKITTPTLAALRAEHGADPWSPQSLDPLTTAAGDEHGTIAVTVLAHPQVATLTQSGSGLVSLAVLDEGGTPKGAPVTLDQRHVARLNRLLDDTGLSVVRNWRTKTHDLHYGAGKSTPLTNGSVLGLVPTGVNGHWRVTSGPSTGPKPAPAPQSAPLAPQPAQASPQPAPLPPSPGTPIPAPTPQPAPEPEPEVAPEVAPGPSTLDPLDLGTPPAYAGAIVLDKAVRAKWAAVRWANTHRGPGQGPIVVAITGPSGAGKTHAVHALAAEEGMAVVKFDASGVVEPSDWFGTVTLDGQGTRFVPSDLLQAITLPGRRVLLLDEMNRSAPRALNALLPVLEGSGSVTIPQSGKRERLNPDVQIVVTANIGSAFLATEPLDEAIRTRIGAWIEVGHLAEGDETGLLQQRVPGLHPAHAANLARLGVLVRESAASASGGHPPVSTRVLIAAGRLIASGLPARTAVEAAVLDGYLSEGGTRSERAKVRTHVAGIDWAKGDRIAAGKEAEPEALAGEVSTERIEVPGGGSYLRTTVR